MKTNQSIISLAKQTISTESAAIANLINFVDEAFENAVKLIHNSNGRVIITGIGKSAIVAQKIVATMNSTGTPAIFMHAADAIHGDLGNIQNDDTVVCISNSGNTPEIKVLVPLMKNYGNNIVAITGNPNSFLGQEANFVLNSHVDKEACPNNLAPTSSTTAQMVIGDALAVCLLELNDFGSKDFAKYHPGGSLGKKLYLRVSDLVANNEKPEVSPSSPIKDVLMEISKKRLGATAVLENNEIVGIITDGDIRRMLNTTVDFSNLAAHDIMSLNPKTIDINSMAVDTLETMESNNISQILVKDNGVYAGVVHLHDLIKEGIF
ncbi:KpsF/GutQ family sugar-phosphate isomerase [Urechidicola vernalis]|uniref:KpsF/GutQ family sugar-phosphate isomerase n=1 Tax=Urechidicola vernalis TaxID=3075600 RepID=A0ABU2Y214_9FLAO|nr:KpsF/GutQ family sugar-phosphate isomerase [Urechidicola sp. P050]MDT0552248.1 KpsF/GutQ family sugar-phosphate isomerase [Urechidicola sp. P050]